MTAYQQDKTIADILNGRVLHRHADVEAWKAEAPRRKRGPIVDAASNPLTRREARSGRSAKLTVIVPTRSGTRCGRLGRKLRRRPSATRSSLVPHAIHHNRRAKSPTPCAALSDHGTSADSSSRCCSPRRQPGTLTTQQIAAQDRVHRRHDLQ